MPMMTEIGQVRADELPSALQITQCVAEVGRQGANQTPWWVAIAKVAVTGSSCDSRSGLMANACRLVLHPLHAVFNVADL